MKRYLNIQIDREHSDYPSGLKHKKKDTLYENSLVDLELIWHKVAGIWKGHGNGKRNNEGSEEESHRSAKEILRGLVFRLLYEDWDSADREGENRGIERLYLEMEQGESKECAESGEFGTTQSRNESQGRKRK